MSDTADLLDLALTIYERDGRSGVEQWAEQPEIAAHTVVRFCDACESNEPHINDICAVCWTAHGGARSSVRSNADPRNVLEQVEERYEVIYAVTLSLPEGDPGPSRRELQQAIYRETDLDTIDAIEVTKGFGTVAHDNACNHQRFWLDSSRLAAYVISNEEELFGFDSADERGFAAAIASRFRDAEEAGAIFGPDALEVVVYALNSESLIVAVRERELPSELDVPMRQLATFSFDATDLVCYGDDSFEECCNGIAAILERANELLLSFAALREAEFRAVRS